MKPSYPIRSLRENFPVTRDMVYVNHAAVSPYSTRVHEAIAGHAAESLERGGVDFESWLETRERLRRLVAQLIHATPDSIAFVKNTSEGLNHVASGLPWKSGDRIILADCEFPANVYPFLHLERLGVQIDFVKAANGWPSTDDFARLITPRTRLMAVSFVEFVNGHRNDLKALGEICRRHDILLSVDAIQGLGAVPLDVQACGIDFLSCGAHKWLMAPSGIGFLYIRPALLKQLTMGHIGWLSVKDAWNFFDFRIDLLDDARRYEMATENWIGIHGMLASIGLLMETGIEAIYDHVVSILDPLVSQLSALDCRFLSSLAPAHRSGILTFAPPRDTRKLFDLMSRERVHCSLREGAIRISPHLYNDDEDIARVADVVTKHVRNNV